MQAGWQNDFGELPGLIFAIPYVKQPKSWGFVLDDGSAQMKWLDTCWVLPIHVTLSSMRGSTSCREVFKRRNHEACRWKICQLDEEHVHGIGTFLLRICTSIYWFVTRERGGRKLIEKALEHLKDEGIDAVRLGIDPRNDNARIFYDRLVFKIIEGAADNEYGLRFWGPHTINSNCPVVIVVLESSRI